MVYRLILLPLFAIMTCEAAYKVTVKNHTDTDIKAEVKVVGLPLKPRLIKKGKQTTFNTKGLTWKEVVVSTMDGKRKGSGGHLCISEKIFVSQEDGKEYYMDCIKDDIGTTHSHTFDVFLPSQGKAKVKEKGRIEVKYKEEPIKDTGKNLIVVKKPEDI